MEPQQPFDIEVLEQRAFERSKHWAKLLDDYVKEETNILIDIEDIDDIFKDEDESDGNDLDGTHAQLDDEALVVWESSEKPDNDLQRMNPQSKRDLTLISYGARDNDMNKSELQDLLDQTLPILEEHKRKWKEAGIEKVLKTFDANKIEKHVGEWLRRNNSAYFDKSPLAVKRHNQCREKPMETESSEAESMHSVDTARYIRSSRKNHGHHRSVSAHCTKMTIKTYRMVKSKRDELRKKYGCPEYDDDHRHRIQEVKCRRLLKQQRDYDDSYCQGKELQKSSDGHHISQRRKQLRKRRSNSVVMMLSSEEELDESLVCCQQPNGHYRTKSPRHCCSMQRSVCGYRQKRSPLRSHCTANGHSIRHIERSLECEKVYLGDVRPYRRENECRCCNDSQLCENVRHLVNSSTEEWLVENSDSFETTKSNSFKSQSKVKFAKEIISAGKHKAFKNIYPEDKMMESSKSRKFQNNCDSDTEISSHAIKSSEKRTNNSKSHDATRKVEAIDGPRPKQKDEKAVKQKQRKAIINISESNAETYPPPAKPPNKSINKSKSQNVTDEVQQKQKDQRQRTRQISVSDESLQPEMKPKHQKHNKEDDKGTKSKPKSTSKDKKRKNGEDASFDEELKLAIKLSKEQYKLEKDLKKQESRNELVKTSENANKTKEEKNKANHDNTTMKTENTFLTNISNMCNSTALSSDKAGDREFSHQPVKRVAAVSTTNLSSSSSSSGSKSKTSETRSTNKLHLKQKSSKSQYRIDDDDVDDDNDCTIVTSTTGIDASKSTQNNTMRAQVAVTPATTSSKRRIAKETEKGILIYAPHAREMAPSHSLQNGYFHITEEHLSKVVGESVARKFFRCYIGRRRFDTSSTVYYRPPANATTAASNAMSCDDSDSDDDVLGDVARCGELYESPEK